MASPILLETVTFTLYKYDGMTGKLTVVKVNADNINKEINDWMAKLYLIVHGWQNNDKVDWVKNALSQIILKYNKDKKTVYVITVNWESLAKNSYEWKDFKNNIKGGLKKNSEDIYINAARSTQEVVGPKMYELLKNLPLLDITCVGHSLGAQSCGAFGRLMSKNSRKIKEIVGLDPAAPCFDDKLFNEQFLNLDKDCAEFVQIIHTNAGYESLSFNPDITHVGTRVS
jgi:hypothetical protein